jgi:hypothetical protein
LIADTATISASSAFADTGILLRENPKDSYPEEHSLEAQGDGRLQGRLPLIRRVPSGRPLIADTATISASSAFADTGILLRENPKDSYPEEHSLEAVGCGLARRDRVGWASRQSIRPGGVLPFLLSRAGQLCRCDESRRISPSMAPSVAMCAMTCG